MGKRLPVQESFSSGEITPLLHGQVSSDAYKSGLKTLTNWITDSHGPIYSRDGSEYLDSLLSAYLRIIVMPHDNITYVLLLGTTTMLAYSIDDGDISSLTMQFDSTYPYTTSAELLALNYKYHPEGRRVVLLSKYRTLYEVEWNATTVKMIFDACSFVSPPSEWSATSNAYPTIGEFFKGRFYVSGCAAHPNRIWASRTSPTNPDYYYNFLTGVDDDHAIDFYLTKPGAIRWLAGVKDLLVGTSENEILLTPFSGEVMTPTSGVSDTTQSSHGSAFIDPICDGNSVIFVNSNRRRLYEMSYDWSTEGWVTKDLTFGAEHLFTDLEAKLGSPGIRIESITFVPEPINMLFVRVSDALTQVRMVTASYDKNIKRIAWQRYWGQYFDLVDMDCVYDHACGNNSLLMIVDRASPNGYNTLEHYKTSHITMDCIVETTATDGAVTGVTTLASKTVGVVYYVGAPDYHYLQKTPIALDSSGDGDVGDSYSGTVWLGLLHSDTAILLPKNVSLPQEQNSYPAKKQWNKMYLSLVDSHLPKVNGIQLDPATQADVYDGSEDPVTDVFQCTVLGWSHGADIEITLTSPFRCTLTAIFGETNEEVLG